MRPGSVCLVVSGVKTIPYNTSDSTYYLKSSVKAFSRGMDCICSARV